MTDCPHCDRPVTTDAYITGVVVRHHTDQFHAMYREGLLLTAHRTLLERLGVLDGHRITIRFTSLHAWYECTCGTTGDQWYASVYADKEARRHLRHHGRATLT